MLAFKQPIANEIVGQPIVVVQKIKQQDQNLFSPAEDSDENLNQVLSDEENLGQKQQTLQIKSLENVNALQKKDVGSSSGGSGESSPLANKSDKKTKICYQKSVTPTDEQLEKLNLQEGANEISFTVSTKFQGTQTVKGRMFLWDYTKKIIISDVDGTITKSDMLGHVLPRLGKDWSHKGIAKLYTAVKKNGYELLYLSSRPIG